MTHMPNENNGLISTLWGSCGWVFLFSVAFGYPVKPTDEKKNHYLAFFRGIGHILPCIYCRQSYLEYIDQGDTKLDMDIMQSRESLTRWLYRLRNRINEKLDVYYAVTYEEVVDKYESFRAKCGDKQSKKCVTPIDMKACSYRKLYRKDAPVIPIDVAAKFINLAKSYGLSSEYYSFLELAKHVHGDIPTLKTLTSWRLRNEFCQMQINHMRLNGIDSIDQDNGLPTVEEVKLIMFMSSNLGITELRNINIEF